MFLDSSRKELSTRKRNTVKELGEEHERRQVSVVGAMPMKRKHHDMIFRGCIRYQFSDRRVDGRIYGGERVFREWIIIRPQRVILTAKVLEMVGTIVNVRKHREEQVPVIAAEQVTADAAPALDAF